MNTTGQHIPFSRLADLADGRLSANDRAEIELHVVDCPRCAGDLAWLRRVIGLMRTDASERPPAHAVAAVNALFQAPRARRRLSAALHFDSQSAPIALGLRAAAPADRQMLFTAADYLVDLRIVPIGALWAVSGQLLGADAGEQIELRGPNGHARATPNEISEFALPPVPPGSYELVVQLADLDITITGLELGA